MARKIQRQRKQFISQNRQTAIAVDNSANDERTQILSSLGKFAKAGATELNRQQAAEIETKKVIGASRAAQDLLKAEEERHGITEDDVLATKLSYNAIVGKHDTMNAGNEFASWYSSNPSASDEDIEAKKTELYQPILEKYGSDQQSIKQISLQVQESQFSLLGVQDKIKTKYTKEKNLEALSISVNDLMSSPDADVDTIINSELPSRVKALGLGEFDGKKLVMQEAVSRAGEGDSRLLDKLETIDWAKGSTALKKARSDYDKFVAREGAPAIGNAMADIEIEMNSLSVPWATTLRKIEGINEQFPNTYSASKVAQLKRQRAENVKKADKLTTGTVDSFKIYTDSSQLPLAFNPAYSDKDRKALVSELDGKWASKQQELTQAGVDPSKARDEILKDQLKWSRLNRVALPTLKSTLDQSINLDLDEIADGQDLPSFATDSFSLIKKMDATAIDLYLPSSKDAAFAMNFKKFAGYMSDDAAYRKAALIKKNPFKVSPTQREEQRGQVRSIVNDELVTGFLDDINPFSEKIDVPEWQREQLVNRLTSDAENYMFAGGFDAEENARQALKVKMSKSFQMFNGTLLNQPLPLIHKNISDGRPMDIRKTGEYLEAHMLSLKPLIEESYGAEVDVSDLTYDFNRDGSSFTIMDRNGEQIGGRFLTNDMYDVGRNADLAILQELNRSEEASRAFLRNELMKEGIGVSRGQSIPSSLN